MDISTNISPGQRLLFLSLLFLTSLGLLSSCDATFGEDSTDIRVPVSMNYQYGLVGPYDFQINQLVFPFRKAELDSLFSSNGLEVTQISQTEALTASIKLVEPLDASLAIFEQIILVASAQNQSDLELGSVDQIEVSDEMNILSFELRSNRDISNLLQMNNFELRLLVRPRQNFIDQNTLYRLDVDFEMTAFVDS